MVGLTSHDGRMGDDEGISVPFEKSHAIEKVTELTASSLKKTKHRSPSSTRRFQKVPCMSVSRQNVSSISNEDGEHFAVIIFEAPIDSLQQDLDQRLITVWAADSISKATRQTLVVNTLLTAYQGGQTPFHLLLDCAGVVTVSHLCFLFSGLHWSSSDFW